MSIQMTTNSGIPTGFGLRLKAERKRLGLSQAQLAEIGGIGRLAQVQYESEATSPTTRYLSAIASAGIDLAYLVLGIRFDEGGLTPEKAQEVEDRAFDWVQKYAQQQPDGKLSAETHKILFRLCRGCLTQMAQGKLPADLDLMALINGQGVA